jgi:hypothetical protein
MQITYRGEKMTVGCQNLSFQNRATEVAISRGGGVLIDMMLYILPLIVNADTANNKMANLSNPLHQTMEI